MKVFLTGAAGKLGTAAAHALLRAGYEIVGADRRVPKEKPEWLFEIDLLDESAVREQMTGCDVIVHAGNHPNVKAAPTPQIVYRENVAMNVNVFQTAADLGIRRWLFASSIQACSGGRHHHETPPRPSELPYLPMDGRLPPNPGNLYALSKIAGEDMMRFYARQFPDLSAVALRFPMLVDVSPSYLEHIRSAYARGRFPTMLDEGFSYLTLNDAAQLILALLEHSAPGFHTLLPAAQGNKLGLPPADIVRVYYAGVPLRIPAERMESLVDISEITRWCGWTPRDNHIFDVPLTAPIA